MKKLATLLALGLLALAGCGGDNEDSGAAPTTPEAATTEESPATTERAAKPTGTSITLGSSEFGRMLVNSEKQAIYIFQNDSKGRTVCYGECAEAWPPVYTRGEPRAADGVKASLLGTVKRRDGRLQVTYAGKPLYYYTNEGPGEVRCHNVNLNGGLWWAVGADGNRLQ
jgi:predicted lipoprotein with Yx(FWY)xxD motif